MFVGLNFSFGPQSSASGIFKILGVLAVPSEPAVKLHRLWIGDGHNDRLPPKPHPADASTAWRRSVQMAVEPQPFGGTLADAAAGSARPAVETAHSVAAAISSHPPGIAPGHPAGAGCIAQP